MANYEDVSLRTSMSQASTADAEEKEQLLDEGDSHATGPRKAKRRLPTRVLVAMGLLAVLNVALITALAVVAVRQGETDEQLPSWMPPERYTKKLFIYQSVFGSEPSKESEGQWTKLIPSK